jgi:hypothetical protein
LLQQKHINEHSYNISSSNKYNNNLISCRRYICNIEEQLLKKQVQKQYQAEVISHRSNNISCSNYNSYSSSNSCASCYDCCRNNISANTAITLAAATNTITNLSAASVTDDIAEQLLQKQVQKQYPAEVSSHRSNKISCRNYNSYSSSCCSCCSYKVICRSHINSNKSSIAPS